MGKWGVEKGHVVGGLRRKERKETWREFKVEQAQRCVVSSLPSFED
jgi:hypothetical protein